MCIHQELKKLQWRQGRYKIPHPQHRPMTWRKRKINTTSPLLIISVSYRFKYTWSFLLEIDECLSNPCLNDATCTESLAKYTCQCTPAYTGTDCNIGQFKSQHGYIIMFASYVQINKSTRKRCIGICTIIYLNKTIWS